MSVHCTSIPYFSVSELSCSRTGIICLDIRFAVQLPMLRHLWGRPLNPTSVCRTPEYNEHIGGHERSLHLTKNPVHPVAGTMAADFWWKDWHKRDQKAFARLALKLDWSVGLNRQFIHVDRRSDFGLREVVFEYDNWDNKFKVEP